MPPASTCYATSIEGLSHQHENVEPASNRIQLLSVLCGVRQGPPRTTPSHHTSCDVGDSPCAGIESLLVLVSPRCCLCRLSFGGVGASSIGCMHIGLPSRTLATCTLLGNQGNRSQCSMWRTNSFVRAMVRACMWMCVHVRRLAHTRHRVSMSVSRDDQIDTSEAIAISGATSSYGLSP